MQQLTLFSSHIPRAFRGHVSRRSRKNIQPELTTTPRWDLWSQETEAQKEMALFFLDIRNFTPLVEKHQPSDVVYITKKLFSIFRDIIRVHAGRIIETSGDGFYAAFGFEGTVMDAVNAAVEAGRKILETLENLNAQSLEKNLGQRIEVGIGVHVGKVATGNLHLGAKDHFLLMGYPVNVASRIQAATKSLNNNFIVSSDVFCLLRQPIPGNAVVRVNLKGMTNSCDLHLIGRPY